MTTQDEPRLSEDDLAYVGSEYLSLEQLCADRTLSEEETRALIGQGRLPHPTYVLPDGTEMFPPDYFTLLDDAGSVDALRAHFDARHRSAASALGLLQMNPDADWQDYLSGEFGACLVEVSPEAMVEQGALVAEIEGLVAAAAPADDDWRHRLSNAVDQLDELDRPSTDFDRQRWGTTTRDRLITAVRVQYLSTDATTG